VPAQTQSVFGHRLAHAEINALIGLAHSATNIRECALYSTLEPCVLCIGAIRMVGLKDVRYAERDPVAGGTALLEATNFMRRGATSTRNSSEQPHGQIGQKFRAVFRAICFGPLFAATSLGNWRVSR